MLGMYAVLSLRRNSWVKPDITEAFDFNLLNGNVMEKVVIFWNGKGEYNET